MDMYNNSNVNNINGDNYKNTSLLNNNMMSNMSTMSNSIMQKKLSEYLLDYDDKYGVLLRICGGFHIPNSWNEHRYITLWKYFLYTLLGYFTIGVVIPDVYYLAIDHSGLVLWGIGVLLQCLILIPVLYITFHRLNQYMTIEYAVAVAPTLEVMYEHL